MCKLYRGDNNPGYTIYYWCTRECDKESGKFVIIQQLG